MSTLHQFSPRIALLSAAFAIAHIPHASADAQIRAGDDFYAYANQACMADITIPPGKNSWGPAIALAARTEERLQTVLTDVLAHPGHYIDGLKLATFHHAYTEGATLHSENPQSMIAPLLKEIRSVHSQQDLARWLGKTTYSHLETVADSNFDGEQVMGLWITQGFDHPDRYAAYLLQGGLGLAGRDDYLLDSDDKRALRQRYRDYIQATLDAIAWETPAELADQVMALEISLARTHATREESDDEWKAHNIWPLDSFTREAPGLDWPQYFHAAGLERASSITVWHPGAVRGLARLVHDTDMATWRAYLAFHAVNHYAPVLNNQLLARKLALYEGAAVASDPDAWRRQHVTAALNQSLGDALGRIFSERYLAKAQRQRIQTMVAHIRAAYAQHLAAQTWMSPATRREALNKLRSLYIGVGWPEHIESYASLQLDEEDAFDNQRRIEQFQTQRQLKKLGRRYDRSEWGTLPQLAFAVNMGMQNQLNFAAAYLQAPYFDATASDASNYGSIGVIIGHEINHMFDETGTRFDARARLRQWWLPQEIASYEQALAPLETQYSAIEALPGLHIDGKRSRVENLADLTGVEIALRALHRSQGKRSNTASDRELFLGFARARCMRQTEQGLRTQLANDNHAPLPWRIATVRNTDAWYEAFDVQPGQALYLPPESRVRIP